MNPMSVLGLGRRRAEDETEGTARLTDLVLITGYSGAGKSSTMQFFEDAGYFCVDNLPPGMIRSLAELFMHEGSKVERAAVVSDARGGAYFLGTVRPDYRDAGAAAGGQRASRSGSPVRRDGRLVRGVRWV